MFTLNSRANELTFLKNVRKCDAIIQVSIDALGPLV